MAKDSISKIRQIQAEARAVIDEKALALLGEARLSLLQKFLHFWLLVGRSFVQNRCPVRASALAYTTLLALVPLLAVGVGVSTTLLKQQGEKPIEQLINTVVDEVAPQLGLMPGADPAEGADARREVARRIAEFIANVHSGALGVTGTLALILVAIGLLGTIEKSFNDIWGVPSGRSWFSQVIRYWAAITLGPLLVILATGFTIGSQLEAIQRLPFIGNLVFKLIPFLILTGAFMLFYQLMPNTRVHWKAALVGAAIGSLLWNLNGNFNVIFTSRVVTTSKIYGSLGIIPVFLIGLYFSWLILLFGAQVAYTFQNRSAYLQAKQAENVNQIGREFVTLRLMTVVGQRFHNGGGPPTCQEIAETLSVPSRLISQLVLPLLDSGLLVEVNVPEAAYTPGRPLENITCHDILHALRAAQGQELATRDEPTRHPVRTEFERIQEAERREAGATTLMALVKDAQAAVKEQTPKG